MIMFENQESSDKVMMLTLIGKAGSLLEPFEKEMQDDQANEGKLVNLNQPVTFTKADVCTFAVVFKFLAHHGGKQILEEINEQH